MRKRDLIINLVSIFCLSAILLVTMPSSSLASVYDPWRDIDGNGIIDMKDIGYVVHSFGTSGIPLTKASIEYDSGWIDITDKCGQYFNIAHNLNSTDIIVDITGKTTPSGGIHQKYLGGTDFIAGWNKTYGGASGDVPAFLMQTSDGGYALTGYTHSFGAGDADFWLIKTDAAGNAVDGFKYGLAWVNSTTNTIGLYRGTDDEYWNYVRVRIWEIKA